MNKKYIIYTKSTSYNFYCTKEEAMAKFQHFCKCQCDLVLYEWTRVGYRKIAECHH